MKTFFIILLICVFLFALWWFKGSRDAFILKDKLVYILVNKYGLDRAEAIILIDRNMRYIFELDQLKTPPSEIADRLYNLL